MKYSTKTSYYIRHTQTTQLILLCSVPRLFKWHKPITFRSISNW